MFGFGFGTPLAVGTKAPEFTLPDQDGRPVALADALKAGPAVVYFYPRDDTPGCTAEACKFRDDYQDFTDAGAQVFGISQDDVASHKRFAERHRLPFRLLADTDDSVHKAYGVQAALGVLRGRVTYVIDRQGIVRHSFDARINAVAHVRDALQVLRALKDAP
ncbi:MAG: peroxiredoxin [Deltaproteobacteria bacterium]|nr:peroxiredoxin [Deltaproteobacteria bacterium]